MYTESLLSDITLLLSTGVFREPHNLIVYFYDLIVDVETIHDKMAMPVHKHKTEALSV